MRKVFSSQRLENVEAVAELLRKEGIAVKISNGRSYRSSRRATFSYDSRRTPDEVPSVWIMHSEDQPRGRQLLRDLGLLENTREPGASYLPSGRHGETAGGKTGLFSAKRIRLGLLALTVVVLDAALTGVRDALGSSSLEWTVPGAGLLVTGLGYVLLTVLAWRLRRTPPPGRG